MKYYRAPTGMWIYKDPFPIQIRLKKKTGQSFGIEIEFFKFHIFLKVWLETSANKIQFTE